MNPFKYTNVVVNNIHDGDTIDVTIDLGFSIKFETKVRFYGINAIELKDKGGIEARDWLIARLKDKKVVIETFKNKQEKYGRYLATIWCEGENVNDELVKLKYAVPYMV